jgi:hypothetical protein
MPDLVVGAHPERLLACLGPGASLATARRLQDAPRLRGRLQALLVERFATGGDAPSAAATATAARPAAADASILEAHDLDEAARLAGAIWHARALKLLVTGAAVGGLIARIGRRAYGFGLRNAASAIETTPIADPDLLAEAIERDGFLCLGARFATDSRALRLRLLTRLPPGTPAEADSFPEVHLRNAPEILARVAAELNERPHGA